MLMIYTEGWSCGHPLPSTYQDSRLPEADTTLCVPTVQAQRVTAIRERFISALDTHCQPLAFPLSMLPSHGPTGLHSWPCSLGVVPGEAPSGISAPGVTCRDLNSEGPTINSSSYPPAPKLDPVPKVPFFDDATAFPFFPMKTVGCVADTSLS